MALFSSKCERKRLARLSSHLKKIQDSLGSLNDFVAHRKMAADAALKASRQHRRALAFASGVVLGREDQAVRPLMKVAAKEVRALRAFAGAAGDAGCTTWMSVSNSRRDWA
jgi:hypothetical protein